MIPKEGEAATETQEREIRVQKKWLPESVVKRVVIDAPRWPIINLDLLEDGQITIEMFTEGDGPFPDSTETVVFESLDVLKKAVELLAPNQK